MIDSLFVLLLLLIAATALVLIAGVVVMARGGKVDKAWSNRLMVARVTLQAIAIGTLLLLIVFSAK